MGVEHEHQMVLTLPRRELIANERMVQIKSLALFAACIINAMTRAQRVDRSSHLVGAHGSLWVQMQVDAV